ncbi:ABC transporter permease [Idiomarina xiamenensis]|uniref:Transport permease protein n=1 Tax=Idiomarina xiamenensis 10-D-4 TaxID=740709 RepID=K2KHX3_9GAMM|nr:ABC transporter permease [Idiomarina xiamenensis]EKE87548.1 putative integral membrane protein [Idiomarina xiamenensis 10-D-4]
MLSKKFRAYLVFDSKVYFQEPMVLFFALIFPAAMYLAFGMLFGDSTYGSARNSYYDEYTASFLGIILLNTALFNIAPSLVVYKELGFFRRLMVTPLSINSIVFSTLVKAFIIFILGMVEVFFLGWLMFDRIIPEYPLQVIFGLAISAFSLFAFGFMLGSLFKRSNSVFSASVLIFQPMLFLSGATIPLETFNQLFLMIAQVIPMYHVVELLRLSWSGQLYSEAAIVPVVVSVVIGVICIFVANRTFEKSAV